jgi:hypothetical protein
MQYKLDVGRFVNNYFRERSYSVVIYGFFPGAKKLPPGLGKPSGFFSSPFLVFCSTFYKGPSAFDLSSLNGSFQKLTLFLSFSKKKKPTRFGLFRRRHKIMHK